MEGSRRALRPKGSVRTPVRFRPRPLLLGRFGTEVGPIERTFALSEVLFGTWSEQGRPDGGGASVGRPQSGRQLLGDHEEGAALARARREADEYRTKYEAALSEEHRLRRQLAEVRRALAERQLEEREA